MSVLGRLFAVVSWVSLGVVFCAAAVWVGEHFDRRTKTVSRKKAVKKK